MLLSTHPRVQRLMLEEIDRLADELTEPDYDVRTYAYVFIVLCISLYRVQRMHEAT